MKGDFSRFTHDPSKRYTGVLKQQGRVDLDADWNEYVEIQDHLRRTMETDLIGGSGVPDEAGGFHIRWDTVKKDLAISPDPPADPNLPSRIYVDSILCELEKETFYGSQQDYPSPAALAPADGRVDLVYLDVWQRHITAVEDPDLREEALAGPDTTTRLQTVWQVKVWPTSLSSLPATCSPDELPEDWPPAGLGGGRLSTGGSYRGSENRLYRVEIHHGGKATSSTGYATFKWSRDNGTVVFPVEEPTGIQQKNKVRVSRLGRDQVLALRGGAWVEVGGDRSELRGEPGLLAQIEEDGIDRVRQEVTLADADVSSHAQQAHPKVRRWDQTEGVGCTFDPQRKGSCKVREGEWIELEDGVNIRFEPGNPDHEYRTGDFWIFTVRAATGKVEQLDEAPPRGIRHHYSPLALVKWSVGAQGATAEIRDCRARFGSLRGQLATVENFFYLGGDGQQALPGKEVLQPLRVGLTKGGEPLNGREVTFTIERGNGRLRRLGGTYVAPFNSVTVETQAGIAECAWQLDTVTQGQQVRATVVDGSQAPVVFTANLSGWSVAGTPDTNPVNNFFTADGKVGIGISPSHRLHVHSTGGTGNEEVRGVHSTFVGTGIGSKFGVSANVSGSGAKFAGQFWSTDTAGFPTYGVHAIAEGSGNLDKIGVYGVALGNGEKQGGRFLASGAGTQAASGVSGIAIGDGSGNVNGVSANATGTGTGWKYGFSSSVTGAGVKFGGEFVSNSAGNDVAYGAHGRAVGGGNGTKYGIYGSTSGNGQKFGGLFFGGGDGDNTHTGVQARAYGEGSGFKIGVSGAVDGGGPKRGGLFTAESSGPDETMGIFCSAFGSGTGTKYALYATQGGGGTRWAGYFHGNVHVAGTLSKGGGAFLIDHPEDPYNKTLRHNFVESPENLCLYRGKIKLNARGKATVRMPDYFAALTKEDESTVYLTAIGEEPSPTSYKWEETYTSLTIFGAARSEVAYLVLADRDDPAIHLLSRPVEEEKGEGNFERGKLLNPEAFGESEEVGIAPPPQPQPTLEEPVQPEPLVLEMPEEIKAGGLGAQGEPLGPKVAQRKRRGGRRGKGRSKE